jgi:hypothetical protein
MEAIYCWPLGAILKIPEIRRCVAQDLSEPQFIYAINHLEASKIITVTGKNRETIFVSDPALAHIFGICVAKRDQYNLRENMFGKMGQLSLPFLRA